VNISYGLLQPHFNFVLALGQQMQGIELNTNTNTTLRSSRFYQVQLQRLISLKCYRYLPAFNAFIDKGPIVSYEDCIQP